MGIMAPLSFGMVCRRCDFSVSWSVTSKNGKERCVTAQRLLFRNRGSASAGYTMTSLTLHLVSRFLLWPQIFFPFLPPFPSRLVLLAVIHLGNKS